MLEQPNGGGNTNVRLPPLETNVDSNVDVRPACGKVIDGPPTLLPVRRCSVTEFSVTAVFGALTISRKSHGDELRAVTWGAGAVVEDGSQPERTNEQATRTRRARIGG